MSLRDDLVAVEKQIDELEQRRYSLYRRSMLVPDQDKICPDIEAAEMTWSVPKPRYPVEILGVSFEGSDIRGPVRTTGRRKHGSWVRVRPCDPECENRTYLGLYVGDLAPYPSVSINRQTGVLNVGRGMPNPAMYVFALNKIVFGCESWWSPVTSPEDLRKITDKDIESVWYVRALKELTTPESSCAATSGDANRDEHHGGPSGGPTPDGSAGT